MTVEKPKPKQLLRPITTGTNSSLNQSQFLAITCNAPEAREISRVYGAIGFGFASHWLKNWRESFKPITKRSNRNHVITVDSHLKTALFLTLFDEPCFFFISFHFISFHFISIGKPSIMSLTCLPLTSKPHKNHTNEAFKVPSLSPGAPSWQAVSFY